MQPSLTQRPGFGGKSTILDAQNLFATKTYNYEKTKFCNHDGHIACSVVL